MYILPENQVCNIIGFTDRFGDYFLWPDRQGHRQQASFIFPHDAGSSDIKRSAENIRETENMFTWLDNPNVL